MSAIAGFGRALANPGHGVVSHHAENAARPALRRRGEYRVRTGPNRTGRQPACRYASGDAGIEAPPLSAPVLLRLVLHGRRIRVLLEPVAGATGAVARAQPLRHDALEPHLAGVLEHDVKRVHPDAG